MNWEQLKEKIYFEDGTLRDIYITDFSELDWQKWINYVNDNYRVEWLNGETGQYEDKMNFEIISKMWYEEYEEASTARFFIDDIQINAFFFLSTEFDNDIDPAEIRNIEDHEKLLTYLKCVSLILKKEVLITEELHPEYVLAKIVDGKITYLG